MKKKSVKTAEAEVDPQLLENLDMLLDFDAIEEEESWAALQNWQESESVEDVREQAEAESRGELEAPAEKNESESEDETRKKEDAADSGSNDGERDE
ncbi:MAG TPA: hypothetical protein VFV50_03220 [Bdellovibrionales bacterium]|nr:hypothetical protein [Bdellovibrionales bacterium]